MSAECWKTIPNLPNYEVSDTGRVKRKAGFGTDGRTVHEKILSVFQMKMKRIGREYIINMVNIGNSQSHRTYSVASLMLRAFCGPPEKDAQARHLNDISTDDRLSNLAWGTAADNRVDAVINGRIASGEKNGNAKLDRAAVEEIKRVYKPYDRMYGARALGRRLGVRSSTVSSIVNGGSWV